MKQWTGRGIDVYGRCWESSPHVSHFHRHPDEYVEAVLKFLDVLGTHEASKDASVRKKVEQKKGIEQQQQAL